MNVENTSSNTDTMIGQLLDNLRESIALVQVLELNDHSDAYEQIHAKLEEALKSIDGI